MRRLINGGKLGALLNDKAANHQKEYLIPFSSLPDELKRKWCKKIGEECEIKAPLALKQPNNTVRKHLEEYSNEERERIFAWKKIIENWLGARNVEGVRKADVDKIFCSQMQRLYPKLNVSTDALYRKYAAYLKNDLDGMIDKRGGWNKGRCGIDETVWKLFLNLYLSQEKSKVETCHRYTKDWVLTYYPELYADIPSSQTFRRRLSTIPAAVICYATEGAKALYDKYALYGERQYDKLKVNDIWIADNHTLDIQSIAPDGSVHRLYLTALMEAKSGVIVGYNITDAPNSQSTVLAYRSALERGFGIPWGSYFDNGSEFLTFDIAGRGHRKRKSWNKDDTPPTIFEIIDIEMVNAIVCNARAKNIERFFGTFATQLSKFSGGYCGGKITERPEKQKAKVKARELPTDAEVRELIAQYIDGVYNVGSYGVKEKKYKGMSRIQVWNAGINEDNVVFRDIPAEERGLMLSRSTRFQKIKENGVFIIIGGKKIWYNDPETTWRYVGKEVYVRYDPSEVDSVRIFERETDKLLFIWQRATYLELDFIEEDKDKIAELERKKANVLKAAKKEFTELTSGVQISMVAAMLNSAELGHGDFVVERPETVSPVVSPETSQTNPFAASVNSVYIDREGIIKSMLQQKGMKDE